MKQLKHKSPTDQFEHKSKSKNFRRVILTILAVILCVVIIIAGAFMIRLQALSKGAVAIVSKPGDQAGSTTSTSPVSETTLAPIDGTPSDIDVDYNVDVDDPTIEPIYQKVPVDENTINILILSSDARPGEKGGRSDSMMLITYNRKQSTIKLTSFMRDSWVRIDGHAWNRINAAFSFGGIGLAINTVNENFGLDIQNYVTIRFEQFISIVDQLGGVAVKLTKAEIDYINQSNPDRLLDTTPGLKLLNGSQTLIHCRNRHIGNGDFDRTRRQRETLLAVLQKLRQQRDPIALTKLMSFALDNVSTNMKANELFTLALEALGSAKLTLDEAQIPFDKTWHYANEDGRSVIAIDLAKNRTMLQKFLYEG